MSEHNEALSQDHVTHMLFQKTVLMLGLMVCCILFINVLHMKGIHSVGETFVYVSVGICVGVGFLVVALLIPEYASVSSSIQLSWNFFSLVLLPPIIFEGGYTLQRITFVRNLMPILGLALIGGTYSAIVTSVLMYGASRLIYPSFTFIHSLVLGSIVSSTDPISVLGMLPPSTDRNLFMMIFGESALNDAVSVILFKFFVDLAVSEEQNGLTIGVLFMSFIESVGVFIGSAAVGIAIALLFALITKHVRPPEAPIFELLMFLVFAYSSYLISDLVGFTGIIGVFFCGAAMAHYAYDNLSKVTLLSSKVVLRTISSMCDAFVFLYLGLGLLAFQSQTAYNVGFIICCFLTILISRTHVFLIGAFHNLYSKATHTEQKKIPDNHLVFLWFCGLRGAVSFALAVKVLDIPGIPADVRGLIFGTVVVVVVITVLGMGGLTPTMLRVLKLDAAGQAEEKAALEAKRTESIAEQQSIKHSEVGPKAPSKGSLSTLDEYLPQENKGATVEEMQDFMEAFNTNTFFMKCYEWDQRYIKPFFTVQSRKKKKQRDGAGHSVEYEQQLEASFEDVALRSNSNVHQQFRLNDSDDDDDLDRVPLSVAAEMFGIPGSAQYKFQSNPTPATRISRSNSIGSIKPQAVRRSSIMPTSGLKNAIELSPIKKEEASLGESASSSFKKTAKIAGRESPDISTEVRPKTPKFSRHGSVASSVSAAKQSALLMDEDSVVDLGPSADDEELMRK